MTMEFRQLGRSGLMVPALSLGTATFGGSNEFFRRWGDIDVKEATELVDICLEHGMNFFDTADIYSTGLAEEILGKALGQRRNDVLIATKATFPMGEGPNELGSSRYHLIRAAEDSLKRLGTDYIDLYFMHGFDALTPVEETLAALDTLISSGKVRYIFKDFPLTSIHAQAPKAHEAAVVRCSGCGAPRSDGPKQGASRFVREAR
jgi:aryl-alcohol dehydrogenase-like predicted oxidoreductase